MIEPSYSVEDRKLVESFGCLLQAGPMEEVISPVVSSYESETCQNFSNFALHLGESLTLHESIEAKCHCDDFEEQEVCEQRASLGVSVLFLPSQLRRL